MLSGERYAVQRADLLWYAGRLESGEARWLPTLQEALTLRSLEEAKALTTLLQRSGYRVFLVGV